MKLFSLLALLFLLYSVNAPAQIDPLARRAFGALQPRLSPDGKWVALSYQGAIYKMPSDGGALTRLTHGEGWDITPAWSPDGNRIA